MLGEPRCFAARAIVSLSISHLFSFSVWYAGHFPYPPDAFTLGCVFIKFGAVDYEATVWLDGQQVGHHRGGHTPFEVDATSFVKKNHKVFIAVQVKDKVTDLTQPRGKQVSTLALICQSVKCNE